MIIALPRLGNPITKGKKNFGNRNRLKRKGFRKETKELLLVVFIRNSFLQALFCGQKSENLCIDAVILYLCRRIVKNSIGTKLYHHENSS